MTGSTVGLFSAKILKNALRLLNNALHYDKDDYDVTKQ